MRYYRYYTTLFSYMGVFDLLKNKDMREQFQLSSVWFVKLFQVQDKLEARDMTKTDIFVPHQTTSQLFVPRTNCLKHQNSISSPKNRLKKIIQCHKNLSCLVLPCIVLFFLILLYSTCCFANQTHPSKYFSL